MAMISQAEIEDLVKRIVQNYQPQRIILFGSYAWGEPRPDSDVDLLVLLPIEDSPFRAALNILNKVNPKFAVDLIVRSPADAEKRYGFGDPLLREAMDHGRVMYEAAA